MFSFVIKFKDGRVTHLDVPTQESAGALVEVLAAQEAEYSVRGPKWAEANSILRRLTRGKRKRPMDSWFGPVN